MVASKPIYYAYRRDMLAKHMSHLVVAVLHNRPALESML